MLANVNGGRRASWRIVGWGFAACLLFTPAVAMLFTNEVKWTGSDFVFAGVLIGAVGLVIEAAARMSRDPAYRGGMAAAALAAFLIVWINAAVEMIGDDNPYNLLFGLPIAVAGVGALLARFGAAGMARAMIAAAVVHGLVAVGGMFTAVYDGLLSLTFAAPWLLSAWLFGRAARR